MSFIKSQNANWAQKFDVDSSITTLNDITSYAPTVVVNAPVAGINVLTLNSIITNLHRPAADFFWLIVFVY